MDYMTLKEASEKWGVTVKVATIWLIPKDAEKPVDMRTKQGKEQKNAKDTLC